MNSPFVPENFDIPERLVTKDFIIRKLCFSDTKLDYDAVMSSLDIIRQTRGGNWPTDDLSYTDDQIDLGWHQREFEQRSTFAYTVMSLDEKECLGCLYLYPPGYRSENSNDADVDVSFWVTQKAYDKGLYKVLYITINSWLKSSWPFNKIAYTNKKLPV